MKAIDVLKRAYPVMPVMVIEDIEQALPLAEALHNGGINVFEITLRSHCALDAITLIKREMPGSLVGAGTVLNKNNFQQAINAGADFILTPGLTKGLAKKASKHSTPMIPGVASSGEIMLALSYGIDSMKLFPATTLGGEPMLKALAGPFPDVTFCPTGGINAENAHRFLELTNVACVGGSWLTPRKLIREQQWRRITSLAEEIIKTSD